VVASLWAEQLNEEGTGMLLSLTTTDRQLQNWMWAVTTSSWSQPSPAISYSQQGFVDRVTHMIASEVTQLQNDYQQGSPHPLETLEGMGKEVVNLGLDVWDTVTGPSGMQPQLKINPQQRWGADVASLGLFGIGKAAEELSIINRGVEKLVTPEEQLREALSNSNVYHQIDNINVSSPNAGAALRAKLSVLSNVQLKAETSETLLNGRVRYYTKFRNARTPGPTTGARLVTEYNPKTGTVIQWNETYDQRGLVNRIHLKNINGIQIDSPHFPPILREILDEDFTSSISLRGGY
jgi:hypothetical protein